MHTNEVLFLDVRIICMLLISVSPGAKERLVQITGPNEENVK